MDATMPQRSPGRRAVALGRATRRVRAEWRTGGARGLSARLLRTTADRLAPPADDLGIAAGDVTARAPRRPAPTMRGHGPMSIGWVMGPPSAGSGGHTTLFRLIRGLEASGHHNVVHIYDRHCPGDVATSRRVIDDHFGAMTARVTDSGELERWAHPSLDVLIATSWPTAYVVRNAPMDAARAYVVQDFEPWFHPAGSAAVLAEATYRFGFHGICAGRWLEEHLEREYAMACDHFDLGVDTATYAHRERASRRDIVFYARPHTPRRGFGLGVLALSRLAARRDDIGIHVFGEELGGLRLPFACTDHGVLTPAEIDALFNRCAAGLVLSFTNLSLLPLEMLATGCVPVVNDAAHTRAVLDNPSVRYAEPTPEALADALEAVVDSPTRVADARRAATSVEGRGWDEAVRRVERTLATITGRTTPTQTSRPLADRSPAEVR
jgi:glycosyltransferase involved in cell wall biosynthesis